MAYKETSINLGISEGVDFNNGVYNVDQAVGGPEVGTNAPAANMVTDMQLIYYFSYIIYRDGNKQHFPSKPGERFDYTPSQMDYHSEHTRQQASAIIWRFQTDVLRRGKPVYRDGRCDKATGKISSISRSPYTILLFNFYYGHTVNEAYGESDWQTYLMSDPLLPEQLRWELKFRDPAFTWM